jgi:RHS repeat-associated protein
MKRIVLVPIIALAAISPVLIAQTATSTSTETQTTSDNNPQTKKIPKKKKCKGCDAEGKEVTKEVETTDGSEPVCPDGFEEVKDVQSVDYTLGLGTATYQAENNFVAQDLAAREPAFKSYNPPITDEAPFSSSLASEWGRKLVRPVTIGLHAEQITDALFTPSALELYGEIAGDAWIKKDASGALRQILSDQYLTDITVPASGGVLISSYLRSTIGTLDSGIGLYTIGNARRFREVLISRPTETGLDTVDITTTDYSSSETMPKVRGARWVKSGTGAAADWTLSHHSGQPTAQNLISSDELIKGDLGNGITQRTRTIRMPDSDGNPVIHSVTREKYRDLGNNTLRIVERVEAPGTPEELTTTYTYTDLTGTGVIGLNGTITQPASGTTTNLLTGARLYTMQRSDGYWEQFKYQYNGGTKIMLTEKWSVWKNSAFGDKANSRYTTITLEEGSRTVIEKIAGQIVSNVYEKLTLAADGTRTLREEKKTGANTAPLITEHAYFPDTAAEPNKGRIQYTRQPDGTLTRYTYTSVADPVTSGQTALKTTVEHGAVDAAQFAPPATGPVPALTMGTRTETITNSFEKVIDAKSWDIASGLLLEQATATTADAFGRPTHIIRDGNPDDYETFTFACCGVKTHRARDGSLTDYTKDALDRPTLTTVTLGPKTTSIGYAYTTESIGGRTLPKTTVTQSISAGNNNTGSLLVSETVNNLRGQTLISRRPDADSDNTPETTTYTHNPATRTESSTGPDSVTATRTSYADGEIHTSVGTFGGNAITPLTTYDYIPHNLNGGGIRTTKSESDLSSQSLLSSVSSFTNLADRTVRTEFPGYNGSTLVTENTFDERSRAIGQTSTGRPATKRILNLLGETTEFWTDSNGDGQFNDTTVDGIKDSASKTTTDYVTEDQTICRRTRQWARDDGNADKLVSTNFHSPDGTWQKSVPLAGTGPLTVTTATKPLNGNASSETRTYLGSSVASSSLTSCVSATLGADGATTTVTTHKDTNGMVVTTKSQVSDLQGRPTTVIDERGLTTRYSDFTATGTPRKTTFSDTTYSVTTLDAAARPTKVETHAADDTLIATVNTTYHPDGSVAANWGTNTNPTYKLYDLHGLIKELRTFRRANLALAPDENTEGYDATTWNYEPATRLLTRKQYADGKGPDYTYTPDGKLFTRVWARSSTQGGPRVTTTYHYSPSGQLSSTDYSDATPDVSIIYDRLGRKLTQSNGIAQSTFTYDPATLVLDNETISYNLDGQPGFEFTRVLDRSRDTIGRDTGFQLKNGSTIENEASYAYHATTGRISSISNPQLSNVSFVYDYVPGSNLIDAVTGPVHTVDNAWEHDRDVLDVKENKVGATTVSRYDYVVNELGQRTTVSQTGTAFAAARGIIWDYDILGQVTSADSTEVSHDRAYQYDAIGNRREARDGVTAVTGTPNYTANPLNQYSAVGSLSLVHDDDGNTTSCPLPVAPTTSSTLAWDSENRMVSSTVGTATTTYLYDAQSRRIAKTTGSNTTLFIFDGWNCIAEYSGVTLSKTWLWGLDLSEIMQGAGGVGGMLAQSHHAGTTSTYYPTYDGNGNVSEYLDATGMSAAHFEYDPFGNAVVNSDLAGMFPYRFSTKPVDSATGLLYYGYRYYDPLTGRWESRDPIGERGGFNLYGIAGNATIWDYLGLSAKSEACKQIRDLIDLLKDKIDDLNSSIEGAEAGLEVANKNVSDAKRSLQAAEDALDVAINSLRISTAGLPFIISGTILSGGAVAYGIVIGGVLYTGAGIAGGVMSAGSNAATAASIQDAWDAADRAADARNEAKTALEGTESVVQQLNDYINNWENLIDVYDQQIEALEKQYEENCKCYDKIQAVL